MCISSSQRGTMSSRRLIRKLRSVVVFLAAHSLPHFEILRMADAYSLLWNYKHPSSHTNTAFEGRKYVYFPDRTSAGDARWIRSCLKRAPFTPRTLELSMVYAPPGSGYASKEDEPDFLPESYDPTMEYPGTMRPGRTRENIPVEDLPIGDDDPEPIPWPHFQELDFYHKWGSPHPHPKTPNEIIYENGRWATPEEEAEMIRDARRGVRQMREMQEADKQRFVVVDDEEDDDSAAPTSSIATTSIPSVDERAVEIPSGVVEENVILDDTENDNTEDDFLVDLGLDADEDENGDKVVDSAEVGGNDSITESDLQTDRTDMSVAIGDDDVDAELDTGDLNDLLDDIDFDDDYDFSNEYENREGDF